MAGWIKTEKDLESDPRVLRMVKAIERAYHLFPSSTNDLDPCNATALPGVTLVIGALTRLWMYADSHVRDDDTLDLGISEIDEWLGLPGFAALMPSDWLRVIDDHTVELPGYQAHNGVEARKRALTQKRVEKLRTNQKKRTSVTSSNAPALPDQTRPDQTRPDSKTQSARAARDVSPPAAEALVLETPEAILETRHHFLDFRARYPAGTYTDNRWMFAERKFYHLLEAGHSAVTLLDACTAYAAQAQAEGRVGTKFVKSPDLFLSDNYWRGPFKVTPTKAEAAQDANISTSLAWLAKQETSDAAAG